MRKLIATLTLLFAVVSMAQTNDDLFKTANKAYNEGHYQAALDSYQKILDQGQHSAALYFNMGNAYYKLNEIAPSIYYYEKALLLKPNDPEIKNNLAFAQNMTVDAIEQLPKTGFAQLYGDVLGFLSFDQWAIAAIVFMFLFVLGYLAYHFLWHSTKKRLAFTISMVSLFVSIMAVTFAYLEYQNFKKDRPAIVFADEAEVKAEPNLSSGAAFTLHQGTKVDILDQLDDWRKIRIRDGQTGWIPKADIKPLKDF